MKFAQLTPGAGFAPLQSIMYYGQRLVTVPALRRMMIAAISAGVRLRHGDSEHGRGALSADRADQLDSLGRTGYVGLGQLLSTQQCQDVHDYLHDKLMMDRHNESNTFPLSGVPLGVRLGDYSMAHVVACPHILELANSPALLDLATRYIGCKPTISALSLRWSFRSESGDRQLQAFHRDSDDWRYLKVMVYLTDVGIDGGPHVYVLGTHRTRASVRLRFHTDADVRAAYPPEQILTITGQRGAAFAVDTAGIHKGEVPSAQRRLLLQIQYSLLPSYAYCYLPQPYAGQHCFDPYINRLILASGQAA